MKKFDIKNLKLENSEKGKFDKTLFITIILLAIFGVVMIYSASSYNAEVNYGNKFFYVNKQLIGLVLGIAAMLFFSFFDYRYFKKFALIAFIIGLGLLVLVLIPGISKESYGARRWINLGLFTIQPGEIAKFCFVICAASLLCKNNDKNKTLLSTWKVWAIALAYCFLIMIQPNMSTTMCILFVLVIMLFVSGLKIRQFMLIIIPGVIAVTALILLEPYRLKRLMAFINPWENPLEEGFQLIQSLYSLGSGGLFGLGLFQSRQKLLFLPFSESDFIFSIIGEELGLFGAVCVLLVFAFIGYKGIKIALRAKDRFGCYLAVGITSVIIVQVLVNVAVVSGAIPPTGLPLPFISCGSTSLIVFMSAIGILINIGRGAHKNFNDF